MKPEDIAPLNELVNIKLTLLFTYSGIERQAHRAVSIACRRGLAELRRRSPGVYRRSAAGAKKRTMSSRAVGDRISFCIWVLSLSIGPIRARICVS